MTFIKTVPEDEAQGETADLYAEIKKDMGHVPNFVRAFSHRPEVLKAWETLLGKVKANMDYRRYEIATMGAAKALTSSYCMLAHGTAFMENGLSEDALKDLVRDGKGEEFDATEELVYAFGYKIADQATSVTQNDIDALRDAGLSDTEIFDVASAAATRCFISKMADAMGAHPDAHYHSLDADLRDLLVVGRTIEEV